MGMVAINLTKKGVGHKDAAACRRSGQAEELRSFWQGRKIRSERMSIGAHFLQNDA
jgi:hypothetical protein